jgi:hypothetical protein
MCFRLHMIGERDSVGSLRDNGNTFRFRYVVLYSYLEFLTLDTAHKRTEADEIYLLKFKYKSNIYFNYCMYNSLIYVYE